MTHEKHSSRCHFWESTITGDVLGCIPRASIHLCYMQGDADVSAMYQEQAVPSDAQHSSPGRRRSLPYAAGLPAPLPLAFPPMSAVAAEVCLHLLML